MNTTPKGEEATVGSIMSAYASRSDTTEQDVVDLVSGLMNTLNYGPVEKARFKESCLNTISNFMTMPAEDWTPFCSEFVSKHVAALRSVL